MRPLGKGLPTILAILAFFGFSVKGILIAIALVLLNNNNGFGNPANEYVT
jgi:hypothetical protein